MTEPAVLTIVPMNLQIASTVEVIKAVDVAATEPEATP